MVDQSEVSVINGALKVLCRELGVERDRKSVLQVATLLIRLVKEGAGECDELIATARLHLADVSQISSPDTFDVRWRKDGEGGL